MRAVVQRVREARVLVDRAGIGAIGEGLLVYLGIGNGDADADLDYLAEKIAGLRVFRDAAGAMNLSVVDVGGRALVVSQFTLYGDTQRGRRPDFSAAAGPEIAQALYERVVARWRETGYRVATGVFGAHMVVELENDGPVTVIVEREHTGP